MRHETAVADGAEAEIRRVQRAIRRDILELTHELDVGGSASAREEVFQAVQKRIARLGKRLARVEGAALEYAAKEAVRDGGEKTGMEVRYSKERADEICAIVTGGQGKNLAAVFTDNMAASVIDALRTATVSAMRENAVAGGSEKELARTLEEKWLGAAKDGETYRFVDAGGHVWDTKTYVAMNVRTNAMRVYNDCLADTIGRATGSDLVRVSTGGDPDCRLCFPWEGRILSLTGKTKGLPTYEEAREAGCFHPNCVHTLEYVDELLDEEEIALQKEHPVDMETATPEQLDENRYEIDQARYMRDNPDMTQAEARVAVDRDNLEAEIRNGLLREDAREIVDGMTDAQVTALCPNGNPPAFEPTKRATKADPHAADEKWRRGSRGGTVHIDRNATAEHILDVCKVKAAADKGSAASAPPDAILESLSPSERREIIASLVEDAPKSLAETVEKSLRMAPPYMLKAFSEGVAIYDTPKKGEAKDNAFLPAAGRVRINPTSEMTRHPVSIIHESAHAALHALNDFRDEKSELGISAKYRPIIEAAQKEAAALAARWYPQEWERRSALERGTAETTARCHEKMIADLGLKGSFAKQTADVRKAIDCAMDIGASATQGRMFYGHGMSYYAKDRTLALDETVADISAAIATKNKWVLENYPETCAAVKKIVYGQS